MTNKKKKSIKESIKAKKKKNVSNVKKIVSTTMKKRDDTIVRKKWIVGGSSILIIIIILGAIIAITVLLTDKKSFVRKAISKIEPYVDQTIQIPFSHQKGVFNQKLPAPITDHKFVTPELHGSASFLGVDINEGLNISQPNDFHGLESLNQESHNTVYRDLQVPHIYFHLRDMNKK